MAVTPPVFVAAPPVEPARYGLLSASTLTLETDPHWTNGVEWEEQPTGAAALSAADCSAVHDRSAVPDGIPVRQSAPIIVWSGFRCRTVGLDEAQIEQRAKDALSVGELTAVEQTVWSTVPGAIMHPTETTILAAGAPVSAAVGVGLLEAYMADTVGGTAIIHAPRRVAPVLAEHRLVETSPAKLTTILGSTYAFGSYAGSSPAGVAAPAGQVWLAATGQTVVRRSDVRVLGQGWAQTVNPRTNEVYALAQRTYTVSYPAARAAVLITL